MQEDQFLEQDGSPWVRVPAEMYHGGIGVSRSFYWKMLNETPEHALYQKQNPEPPTDSMILGSAYHSLVLEPHLFPNEYVLADVARRSKAGKDVFATYQESGITPLKPETWDTIHRMRDRLMRHPLAEMLLTGGTAEASLYAYHPIWNHLEKIRVDYLLPDFTMVDLKSCMCAAPRQFRSHAYSMGYHVQAAMYPALAKRRGVPVPTTGKFVFIAQETSAPYAISVYYVDDEMERDGLEAYEEAAEMYHNCMTTGVWPGYPETFMPLNSPGWARRERKEKHVYQS